MKKNSGLIDFRDDEEKEMFFIAIPVLLLFGLLGYWLTLDKEDTPVAVSTTAAVSDIDADGVPDNADRCVDRAGIAANGGCPAKIGYANADNDNDGIRNGIDECPETKGVAANNGCRAEKSSATSLKAAAPAAIATATTATAITATDANATVAQKDTDNDGVIDAIDKCPAIAGAETNLGCPPDADDADNDGILGEADACPDAPGSAIDNGCPADADGDGVMNMDDRCPMTAGTNDGCPDDNDKDGVANDVDECPDQAGTITLNGCPADTDGDGVTDAQDRCPGIAGTAENDGCAPQAPDTDASQLTSGDSTAATTTASTATATAATTAANTATQTTGTDSDGDSVPDSIDECPTIAGQVAEKGCPRDSDGDGIADADDLCPAVSGLITLRGCPQAESDARLSDQDQQILDSALANVAFNSNSAILTRESTQILQQVAGLLRKYPDARLEIRGHTDSSGAAARNMQLSMQRARACANFISRDGIDVTRLIAYGYGESQPIASNQSAAGRRTNRRVEFELKF